MWSFFHILLTVSLLAAVISDIDDLRVARAAALKRLKMVRAKFNVEMMKSLDTDGKGGVSRFEFVIGMLLMVGAVDPQDVGVFDKLFVDLDKDGSGNLTAEDIDVAHRARKSSLHPALMSSLLPSGRVGLRKNALSTKASTELSSSC